MRDLRYHPSVRRWWLQWCAQVRAQSTASFQAIDPRSFSFNSPYGACPACNGLGSKYDFDPARVIVDWTRPLFDGGLGPGSGSAMLKRTLELGAYAHGFDLETPFEKFPARIQNMLLYGYPPSNAPRKYRTTRRS